MRLRTGDRAIIIGAVAIAVYESKVRDEADLISRRFDAYRSTILGRLLCDTLILATALHLTRSVDDDWDIYTYAMRYIRPEVGQQK